jgi:hypothetical protein
MSFNKQLRGLNNCREGQELDLEGRLGLLEVLSEVGIGGNMEDMVVVEQGIKDQDQKTQEIQVEEQIVMLLEDQDQLQAI